MSLFGIGSGGPIRVLSSGARTFRRHIPTFVTVATAQNWMCDGIPKELLTLIGQYFCVFVPDWDTSALNPPSHASRHSPSTDAVAFHPGSEDNADGSTQSVVSMKSGLWSCAWSRQLIARPATSIHTVEPDPEERLTAPYFAVRINQLITTPRAAILIGVTNAAVIFDHEAPMALGTDSLRMGVMCSFRKSMKSSFPADTVGMCAVYNGDYVSPILSTDPAPHCEEEERTGSSGYFRAGATIGFVCDYEQNTLTMYVDDEPVKTSCAAYKAPTSPNDWPPLRVPFVWKIVPDLRTCRVYFASFCATVSAELVDWIPPPQPPPPEHEFPQPLRRRPS